MKTMMMMMLLMSPSSSSPSCSLFLVGVDVVAVGLLNKTPLVDLFYSCCGSAEPYDLAITPSCGCFCRCSTLANTWIRPYKGFPIGNACRNGLPCHQFVFHILGTYYGNLFGPHRPKLRLGSGIERDRERKRAKIATDLATTLMQ